MAARRSRLLEFHELISADVIDLKKLKKLCFQGCPDEEGMRPTCWKILLGYLPPETKQWDTVLKQQRALYQQLMNEVVLNTHTSSEESETIDHPLNPNPESGWHRYFQDNDILLQIDHDSRRLYPDMSFFQLPTPYPRARYNASTMLDIDALKQRVDKTALPSQQVATSRRGITTVTATPSRARDPYSPLKEGEEAHWEVVERILFIYAKTHKGISYVQGMNEVLGPIYYVFAQHPDPQWKENAEADAFFCFASLMTEIGDLFTKTLDTAQTGIGGALRKLMKLLKEKDPVLHKHLTKQGVEPVFFGLRWVSLLLSQEFLLPEVIRIWDSLFADEKRFAFLIYLCCAMLITIRSELMLGDFGECVKLLQNYPETDLRKLLVKAQDIQRFHPL